MKELTTERLLLIPLTVNHQDNVRRLYADRKVRRFLGGLVEGENFEERFRSLHSNPLGCTWAIHLKSASSFLGVVTLDGHHDGREQEVSFQQLPKFWGQGYAREAVEVVMDHAFTVLKLPTLLAETQCANHAAHKLLESVGMEPFQNVKRFGEDQIIYRRTVLRAVL